MHFEKTTHAGQWKILLMRLHERILHSECLAKCMARTSPMVVPSAALDLRTQV